MIVRRLLARVLTPRSYCSSCGRPWFSDVRRPCPCGATARTYSRALADRVGTDDSIT